MKRYTKTWCALLFAVLGMAACKKENLDAVGQWDFSGPTLSIPVADTAIVLDNENPLANVRFQWEEAVTSQRFNISYRVVLVHPDSSTVTEPIFSANAADNGRAVYANVTNRAIDEALSAVGYDVGEEVDLQWGVVAEAVGRAVYSLRPISITRLAREELPENLYIAGGATEVNTDFANAIRMKPVRKADGSATGIFELYTSLETGANFRLYAQRSEQGRVYGGTSGVLRNNGAGITVNESGTYRITVNMEESTYSLFRIEKWSMVGSIISGGWGGDVPLEYQGNGIWSASLNLLEPSGEDARFIFRANGDWGLGMKVIRGTANSLLMESWAAELGHEVDDISVSSFGKSIVTLNLSADGYSYTIEEDNSVEPPAATPNNLYLIGAGTSVALTKNGNSFTTSGHVALQANQDYRLNEAVDGSGTNYSLTGILGQASDLHADNVSGTVAFGLSSNPFQVNQDQAYALTIDFSGANVAWKFYNIKLFHWNDWDGRQELTMSYKHPMQFEVTAALNTTYNSKFISPWDIQLGSPAPTAMTGNLSDSGQDINCISESGDYDVSITLHADLKSGSYQFVKK